jgi:hypothetical protein
MRVLTLIALFFLVSCLPVPEKSKATLSSNYVGIDDILVASQVTDSIYQFNSKAKKLYFFMVQQSCLFYDCKSKR